MKSAKAVKAAPVDTVSEHAQGGSDMSALLHDANTWIAVAFVVFVVLVVRYLVPKIATSLDGRADKIRDQLEQASRLRAEAEELLNTYRAQQETMLKEAESIIAGAKRDAAAMRAQAAEELQASLARRTQQAQDKIARAEADAINDIRKRIVDLAADSARSMLAGETGRTADAGAITRALSAVEKKLA